MSVGAAIFVKTPQLSPVKTRLWPGIGRSCAEALHLLSAEAVCEAVRTASGPVPIAGYWAVAETDAVCADTWADLPCVAQGRGGLGTRMATVYAGLRQRHRAVLLIGADAPQADPRELQRAADWLAHREPRLVIGRAHDGGFWLFGGNMDLPLHHWQDVTYSVADTANMFSAQMRRHGQCLELAPLDDIDLAADIPRACQQLARLDPATPAQQRLLAWLHQLMHAHGIEPIPGRPDDKVHPTILEAQIHA
jgi:glycosyltransferase A (GT-A) superfamily protein (DUF2064 family)